MQKMRNIMQIEKKNTAKSTRLINNLCEIMFSFFSDCWTILAGCVRAAVYLFVYVCVHFILLSLLPKVRHHFCLKSTGGKHHFGSYANATVYMRAYIDPKKKKLSSQEQTHCKNREMGKSNREKQNHLLNFTEK